MIAQACTRAGTGVCDEPLALVHRPAIEAVLHPWRQAHGADCLSDFAFANLYLFRAVHAYRLRPGPWPSVTGRTYDGARHVFPLFDLAQAPLPVLDDLLADQDCFFPVHGHMAGRLDPARWRIAAVDADGDYLYRAEQFRSYRGRLLQKKRSQMRQFLAAGTPRVRVLDGSTRAAAEAVLADWLRDKDRPDGDADAPACREALQLLDVLGLEGRVYEHDGRPAGFLVFQRLAEGVAVVRFAKGVRACPGVFAFMFHEFCTSLPALRWLNFEQDLGVPGFRQSKRSFQPARLLAKYRVSRQDGP